MSFSENLYFIAIIPKRELRESITTFKQDFAKRFNSSKALKVYPHITLKAPFKLPPADHEKLLTWFSTLIINQKKYSIQLKNFGTFPNKKHPVVFINPIPNNDLFHMQVTIMVSFISNISDEVNKADIEFKPHVTIAYRDLSPEMFTKAWQEYKDKKFDATFDVDAFYLLLHDSKKWNIVSTHQLDQDVTSF